MFKEILLCEFLEKFPKTEIKLQYNGEDPLKFQAWYILQLTREMKCPVELVHTRQVKPYFDIDHLLDDDQNFDEQSFLKDIVNKINTMFPNKKVYICRRDKRPKDNKIKYSYHLCVDEVRIMYYNIIKMIKDHKLENLFDTSVYTDKQVMYPVRSYRKYNSKSKTIEEIGEFVQLDDEYDRDTSMDICPFAITYIEKDYEDYDLKFPNQLKVSEPKTIKYVDIKPNTNDNTPTDQGESLFNNLKDHINHLSKERADKYETWTSMLWCIETMSKTNKIPRSKMYELGHYFSKKSSKYNEYECEEKMDKIFDQEGVNKYGWRYFKDCIKEDDLEYYKKAFAKTYKEQKLLFEQEVCKLNNPVSFHRFKRDVFNIDLNPEPLQILQKKDLTIIYENWFYMAQETQKDGSKVWKKKKFLQKWLEDEENQCYEALIFVPYHLNGPEAKLYKNMYTGFRAERIELQDQDIDYTKLDPILYHMKEVLCNGDDHQFQYLVQWIAQIIQNPIKKPQVALTFYSAKHGTGKNIFTNFLSGGIFGLHDLAMSTNNAENRIFTRFNSAIANKLLLIIEEAKGDLHRFIEDMKNLITEPTIEIEKKNVNSKTTNLYVNVIFNTNNENLMGIDNEDRRNCIFEVSDKHKGDVKYFDDLYKVLKDDKICALFYKYMKEEVKIKIKNFQIERPISDLYRKIQKLNAPNYVRYLSYTLDQNGHTAVGKDIKTIVEDDSEEEEKETTVIFGRTKWITYSGETYLLISNKRLYDDYVRGCEHMKYKAYNHDTFFHKIIDDQKGIKQVQRKKIKHLMIYKNKVMSWLGQYRDRDVDIPEYEDIKKQMEGDIEEI